jgi:hypothetical protein
VAKLGQTFALAGRHGARMAVVDYDELAASKHTLLPWLCAFAGLDYDPRLAGALHGRSVSKGSRLSVRDAEDVDRFCGPVYARARTLRTLGAD